MALLEVKDITSGYGEVQLVSLVAMGLEKQHYCEPLWVYSNLGMALLTTTEMM